MFLIVFLATLSIFSLVILIDLSISLFNTPPKTTERMLWMLAVLLGSLALAFNLTCTVVHSYKYLPSISARLDNNVQTSH